MKKTTLLFYFLSFASFIHAQSNTVSSGGDLQSNTGSVSYSIGQIVYTSDITAAGSNLKGVQQAYEIYTVTGIENNLADIINISISPNPTSDLLKIEIENTASEKLQYSLTSITGKLIERGVLQEQTSTIDMMNLASAVYFLNINNKNNQQETFKIIKN
jgi:hypothetical protein